MNASTVLHPPATASASGANNRSPLLPAPLLKLPLGSIQPRGWLAHQLALMADGMVGRLPELSGALEAGPAAWSAGESRRWEQMQYWLRGAYPLAVLTGRDDLLQLTGAWAEAVLASQDEDGYFGEQWAKTLVYDGRPYCDHWGQNLLLDTLVLHHEYTGDERVPPLMTRYFRFMHGLADGDLLPAVTDTSVRNGLYLWYSRQRAGDLLPNIHWLYNRTGDGWLLELASRIVPHTMQATDEWLEHHVVNFVQRFRYLAGYYPQSGQRWHLDSAEYWYRQHLLTWGQMPRGVFAADERIRSNCTDPRQAFETCAMVEAAKSFYLLGRITGLTRYADRCEDMLFNHFPAAQTPDLKGLHYLTAPNMPCLDDGEHHEFRNQGKQLSYSPHECYHCCQHNHGMGWPWYAANLWQASADEGLVAWSYAASRVTARVGAAGAAIAIEADTSYPFEGAVRLALQCNGPPVEFPLYLRVPGWCNGFGATVNGTAVHATPTPGQYVRIERSWSDGDAVRVELPMRVGLSQWPRNGAVTVDRGPLSYSVRIEEDWQRCGGTDEWPEWEVMPTTPWNYGLVIDRNRPEESLVAVASGRVAAQPWTVDDAPIEIRARARRIPGWRLENATVQELRPSPIRSPEPDEEIRLIPMGCARLRMSCLPTIEDGPDAADWV